MNNSQQNAILLGILFYTVILAVSYVMFNMTGYEPKDSCAHEIRRVLSPYQISQMTNMKFPVSYDSTASFCEDHLDDYRSLIQEAKSFREFADHDMF